MFAHRQTIKDAMLNQASSPSLGNPRQPQMNAALRRQFQVMDLLCEARRDPNTSHRTIREYVRLGRQYGLTDPQVAAGLGRSQEQIAEILTNGGR